MNPIRTLACVALLTALFWLPAVWAGPLEQAVILDSDELQVFPDDQQEMLHDFQDHGRPDIRTRFDTGEITTKIVDIRNITGHNPLNPDNPVLNTDGQTFDTPGGLKDCVDNNNCSGGSSGYSGSSDKFAGCGAAKYDGGSLSGGILMYKDGFTANCEMLFRVTVLDPDPAGPGGQTLAFRVDNPVVGTQPGGTVLFRTDGASGFVLDTPPAGAVALGANSWAVVPGVYTIVLRHTGSGKRWQYGITITGDPPVYAHPIAPAVFYNFTKVGWTITTRKEI